MPESKGGYEILPSLPSVLFSPDDLEYIRKIGNGGMSNVDLYRSYKDDSPLHVAVKTIIRKHISEREREYLRTEADILASFHHDNIIRTYGTAKTTAGYGLVLEYHPYGSCTDFFGTIWNETQKTEKNEKDLSFIKIRILVEIVSAMKYLHKPRQFFGCSEYNNTLHLDLKPENVLLDQDLHAKICDFGLSRISTLTDDRTTNSAHSSKGVAGTLGFISPERLRDPQYKPTTKCDVYSFGILQYTILTDLPPYEEHKVGNYPLFAYHVVNNCSRPDLSKVSEAYPCRLTELMIKCWEPIPANRPSFKALDTTMLKIRRSIEDFDRQVEDSVMIAKDFYRVSQPPLTPSPTPPSSPPPPTTGCGVCELASRKLLSELRNFCSFARVLGIGVFSLVVITALITIGVIAQQNPQPANKKTLKACNILPQTGNGVLKCSNRTFVHSICSLSCTGSAFVQKTHHTKCLKNATWSFPALSCTCAKCRIGANCEHSTSWKSVSNQLSVMQAFSTLSVNYGGHTIACSIRLLSLLFNWQGECKDSRTSSSKTCSKGHYSPSGSAEAAASQLIRELASKSIYPRPCDAELMPKVC